MARIDSRYIFRIPSPSEFTDPAKRIERLTKDIQTILDEIGTSFKNLSGASGTAIPFSADINMQGHKVTALGDPTAIQDGTNKRYVDAKIDELQKLIDEINRTIHNELPVPGRRDILLTRPLPLTVDDTVELGTFLLLNSAHTIDVAVTVSATGFSVAKAYTLATAYGINTDWQTALPLFDSGPFTGQNFALDVKQINSDQSLALRLRRTAGTTAGTATIQLSARGLLDDSFIESSATASVTAPVVFLESAILSVQDGNVLVNASVPLAAGVGTTLIVQGNAGGDNRGGVELANPDPGTNSPVGEVRVFSGTTFISSFGARTDGAVDAGAWQAWTKKTGVALALALHITGARNAILGGGTTAGSSAEKTLVIGTGTAPGSSPADSVQLYSKDQTAGNATLHIRTENGAVILLFQGAALTAASGGALSSGGAAVLSTADSTILANAITRIAELESRLQASGQIA